MLLEIGGFCTWVEDNLIRKIDSLSGSANRQSQYESDA